jgi:hypothetical protein
MTIAFTNKVLCYCLGNGILDLKGPKHRPWLELVRSEMETAYLRHQVLTLRRAAANPVRVEYDMLPLGKSPYARARVRLQSDELWRAYELLYARDRHKVTAKILQMTGLPGLAALWTDRGTIKPASASIHAGRFWPGPTVISKWTDSVGCSCEVRLSGPSKSLHWDNAGSKHLMATLRPHIHTSMRHLTWPNKAAEWIRITGRD